MLHQYRAGLNDEGITIETFLLKIIGLKPRAALKRAFTARFIKLNGRVTDRHAILHAEDTIEISPGAGLHRGVEERLTPNPALTLEILVSKPDWIAVAKPAGLNTHPHQPDELQTALNALIAVYPETAQALRPDKPLEGALVHRLDRGTSGILVAARTPSAFEQLRKQWSASAMEKVYLAWVVGYITDGGRLELWLDHDPKSSKRMVASENPDKGRRAVTSFIPLKVVTLTTHEPVTLVLIRLHTGVMHQIRATFKAIGHPVLGDPVYLQRTSVLAPERFKRHALDGETQRILKHVQTLITHVIEPDPEALPEQGFFLHAVWLRLPEMADGILATVPKYFG